MEIVITAWALDAYLELKHKHIFTQEDYENLIRPKALLLKDFPQSTEFSNNKFWSPATFQGQTIPDGFKMKWHQLGSGRVQLRLPVGIFDSAFLCEAYVKSNEKAERRYLARFKTHLELIRRQQFTTCGRLE
ncbi:hypothetical protein COW36_16560 [bacterium (Candidatus Blackallbacteria) CG17_big_fil_post_rev_8_21_14_2_50_48_46]|uniref:Uncharacterized protein n=1 Tax=bacterium (Candidatus Blackallbacteria) CG17_big_fil_post_rev_8_21_14_2_50_48_46 TaxID=2014261 RepID=A0A2M7G1I1_9BACT|nr:MAG: hypothetical protein COW64_08095 [bacterium (Candidatus Blackallbacteria) CG18_big_fil_WC_8_21_14_2_50_49_26]PIW15560.1 MAG: hypothetical protein COW36_16560 [bacterium (Candidatus Blackallbacteria) CG17_big_fil_post_rev_8_21_14_2_50_48_46]PIW49351.1 MAG: hypothetical protein COW20_05990 [bacterium (Candidatus Blackallbacteria) CG13_big_fil_rev_8_21_14_2_50_49_14]